MIIDFLLQCVYVYFRKFKEAGLLVATYLLSASLTFNFITLFIFAKETIIPSQTFRDFSFYPFLGFVLFVAPYFIIDYHLQKRFIGQKNGKYQTFGMPLASYYFFGAIYFFGSIAFGLASFKYL